MGYLSWWRLLFVWSVCVLGIWVFLPNALNERTLTSLPSFFVKEPVSLGLDLKGGASVLLEVDLENVAKDHLNGFVEELRRAFRKERVSYTNLKSDEKSVVDFLLRRPEEKEKVLSIIKAISPDVSVSVRDQSFSLVMSPEILRDKEDAVLKQSVEIVRRRIDEMGTKEPSVQRQGSNRILVQLPGVTDPNVVKDILGKTARLSFRLVHPSLRLVEEGTAPPYGFDLVEADHPGDAGKKYYYVLMKKSDVTGEMLIDAQPTVDHNGGGHAVSFSLDAVGARKFAEVTAKNIGRPFAIVLDDKVISAPVINSSIPGGQGIITGAFGVEEARNLALLLRAGALPAPLMVLEEKTVGPELGTDSIRAGKVATFAAVTLIIGFMFFFYGFLFGGIANICLIFNLVLLLATLSFFGATLTLSGVAGIALTLGMAVDANILVFERIREEVRRKQAPLSAIGAGYDRAFSTILDSNLTTIIGAALLYIFGNGPVRGFAVTLVIGILVSMFTAVSLSRVLVLLWVKYRCKSKVLPI